MSTGAHLAVRHAAQAAMRASHMQRAATLAQRLSASSSAVAAASSSRHALMMSAAPQRVVSVHAEHTMGWLIDSWMPATPSTLPAALPQLPTSSPSSPLLPSLLPSLVPSPSSSPSALWCVKRPYTPNVLKRKRKHGFLKRKSTTNGLKTLTRRRVKGRHRMAA